MKFDTECHHSAVVVTSGGFKQRCPKLGQEAIQTKRSKWNISQRAQNELMGLFATHESWEEKMVKKSQERIRNYKQYVRNTQRHSCSINRFLWLRGLLIQPATRWRIWRALHSGRARASGNSAVKSLTVFFLMDWALPPFNSALQRLS